MSVEIKKFQFFLFFFSSSPVKEQVSLPPEAIRPIFDNLKEPTLGSAVRPPESLGRDKKWARALWGLPQGRQNLWGEIRSGPEHSGVRRRAARISGV